MTLAIAIPVAVREQIYAHARRCFPDECCGYLRGASSIDEVVECRNAQLDGDHPTVPARGADSGFVITGAELLAFAKTFDGRRPARIVYHSHTNGRAYLSDIDRDVATANGAPVYPVEHLVIGLTADAVVEAAQFAWSGEWIEVARWSVR
jgi:adenylyltransferase/sulfurtransferase